MCLDWIGDVKNEDRIIAPLFFIPYFTIFFLLGKEFYVMRFLKKISSIFLSFALITSIVVNIPTVVKATTIDFSNAITLNLNSTYEVNIESPNEYQYFKYTPTSTGFYTFESLNISSGDPLCLMYSNQNNYITQHDDIESNSNFQLTYHLVTGQTYYYKARCFSQGIGKYDVRIRAASDVSYLGMNYLVTENSYYITNYVETQATYFKFIPNVTSEYLFYSCDSSGDPRFWIYDSNLNLVGTNDDDGGNHNFKLTPTLTTGQTYYLVNGHYGSNSGDYTLCSGIAVDIPTNSYYIKNIGTGLNIDIHGPAAQEYVHQWSFHISDQEDWIIQKQNDDYYTIKSKYGDQKYIGISSSAIDVDNIKLFDNITNDTKWKIYTTYDGKLFFVPKNATGKVLYAPNNLIGTELQLSWISTLVDQRNEWIFEVKSSTPIEGQRWSNWCWATSARMLTKHYESVSDVRTQNLAVTAVKGNMVNDGGLLYEAREAVGYYHDEDIYNNDYDFDEHYDYILSESDTRRFIDDGHVIYIARGQYINSIRMSGHATLIVGYTTEFIDGEMIYRYIVNDPWPASPPNPWSSPVITNGQIKKLSFDWICNGHHAQVGEQQDDGIWDRYLVINTSYSGNTMTPEWND